jgi:hypothetical protein
MSSLPVSVEEELQASLKLIIPSARCLKSNSICTHLDVKERLEVSIGINFSPKAKQAVIIQPLVLNVKVELSDEKGVEIRGYKIAKVGGSTIGFRGSDVKVEVIEKIQLSYLNVKVELAIEWGFEVEGYNTAKFKSFKLKFQGFDVKIEATIKTRPGLSLKLAINIELVNPKSIFLH